MLPNMLRKDILIMCGVLIAAWFVKVVGVFVYLTYSKRRADSRAAAAASDPSRPQARSKARGTPANIIAALPVMTYSDLPSSSHTCSDCEPQQKPNTLVTTAGMPWQQQQHDTVQQWRRSTDVLPGQQDQQQQRQQRFSLRLSFDSAQMIGKKQLPLTSQLPSPAAAPATAATAAATTEPAEADACAICFCEYEAVSWVKQLPCGHFYHTQCIDTWLAKGTTCPLCKRPVWEEEEQHEQVVEDEQAAAEAAARAAGAAASAAAAAAGGSEQRQEGAGIEQQQQQEMVVVVVLDCNEGAAAATPSAAPAETGAPAVVLGTPVEAPPPAAAAAAAAAGGSSGEAGGHVIDIQHVASANSSRAHAQQ